MRTKVGGEDYSLISKDRKARHTGELERGLRVVKDYAIRARSRRRTLGFRSCELGVSRLRERTIYINE